MAKSHQYNHQGETPSQKPQCKSIYNVHPRPNLPSHHQITTTQKTRHLTPQTLSNLSKHILIGNIWSFYKILRCILPLYSFIINQHIPHRMLNLLHQPGGGIVNQVISPSPNNPHKATMKEQTNPMEVLEVLVQLLINQALTP